MTKEELDKVLAEEASRYIGLVHEARRMGYTHLLTDKEMLEEDYD